MAQPDRASASSAGTILFERLRAKCDGWVVLLTLAFITSRLLWIWIHPASSVYWEEAYRMVAAQELLGDPNLSLLEYQADHYQGGSLVMIILVAISFSIFGISAISFKLPALLFSTGILLLLYSVGRAAFSRSTGLLAAAAYVLGPPLVAWSGLLVIGSHHESTFFALLGILLLLRLLDRPSIGTWFAFGFVAAVGTWFCYTAALAFAACALVYLFLRHRLQASALLAASAGWVVGFTPWIVYNARFGFQGITRILEVFGLRTSADPWAHRGWSTKLAELLLRDLPIGLTLPQLGALGSPQTALLAMAVSLPLAAGLAMAVERVVRARVSTSPSPAARSHADPREWIFVIYLALFLAAYLASSFTMDARLGPHAYRLLVPAAVIGSLPIAQSAILGLRSEDLRRTVASSLLFVYLVASAVGTLHLAADPNRPPAPLDVPTGYLTLGLLAFQKNPSDVDRALDVADRIPDPALRFQTKVGIGWGMEYSSEKNAKPEALDLALSGLSESDRAAVLTGFLGAGAYRRSYYRAAAVQTLDVDQRRLQQLQAAERVARKHWRMLPAEARKAPEWSGAIARPSLGADAPPSP